MNQSIQRPPETSIVSSESQGAIRSAMRFLHAIRHRKHYVIASLGLAILLGGLYFVTATRLYEGNASLLVTQNRGDVWDPTIKTSDSRDNSMPTWERLLSSNVVLHEAVRQIAELPIQARVDFKSRPRDEWIEVIRDKLRAKAVRQTNLIEVSYLSKSPEAARAVVDSVVDSYLKFMEKNHKDTSVEVVAILDEERKDIEQRLLTNQRQLLDIRRRVKDLGLREGSQVTHPVVQRVVNLNETWVDVRKKRVQLAASLAAIRSAHRQGADMRHHLLAVEPLVGRQVILNGLGMTPETSEHLNQLERNLIVDRAELDVMLEHYGSRHPDTLKLQQTISRAENYLADNQASTRLRAESVRRDELGPMLISMVEQQLHETKAHESELADEYTAAEMEAVKMNDRLAELQIVEEETNRLKGFHKSLLNKITSVDINQGRADVRIAVVSEPTASDEAVSPRLSLIAIMCLLCGLGAGAGLVYVHDLVDDRFRSPEELSEQLGKPILAMVRSLPSMENEDASDLPVHVAPQAVESEAFRTLRTTLAFSGEQLDRVAVTSCEPGDGKTTVLANLGVACAQAGKRTLLVDADLRRPGLTRMLGMRGVEGLSQVLRSNMEMSQVAPAFIQPTGVENLDVLACGGRPTDPSELLSSNRMADLLLWGENEYDQLLVDCPPIMAASDAAVIGRLVDGMILVVQPIKNHRRTVLRASDELIRMQVNLFGIVVNRVDAQEQQGGFGLGAGYGYGYGYGYGIGYGDEDEDQEVGDEMLPNREPDVEEFAPTVSIAPRRRAA